MLVFANKQDLPNAMTASELTDQLGLQALRNRKVTVIKLFAWGLRILTLCKNEQGRLRLEEIRFIQTFGTVANVYLVIPNIFIYVLVVHSGNMCNPRTRTL